MPVKLLLAAALGALALSGGFCPKGSEYPIDPSKTGMLLWVVQSGGTNTLQYSNYEGSVQGTVGLGLSPAIVPTTGGSVSPVRGRFLFPMVDSPGGSADLFTINRDGSGLQNLTNTPGIAEGNPDWSREGDVIAYEREGDIWVMAVDGSWRRNLTSTTDAIEADPTCNPDGSEIAYCIAPEAAYSRIGAARLSDGVARVVVERDDLDASEPSWSPTGGRIAFCGRRSEGLVREEVDIWLANAESGGSSRLTDAGGDLLCRSPAWSPDETRLAFRGTPYNSTLSNLYTVRADGSGTSTFRSTGSVSYTAVDWR